MFFFFLYHIVAGDITNVTLENGDVIGIETKTYRYFKGIPFASPPVNDLRWRPPVPPKPWKPEVLNATEFKHNCLQNPSASFMGWPQPLSTLSEDCLYLNVYAPPKNLSKALVPVMVWIFGGGFQGGGGNETRLNGTWDVTLSKGELVIVTFNYRLNIFGFLAADALRDRDAENSTGNYGIQDQRMALQWVKTNIKAFGGDPNRIFIVGQSAGADSVGQHLVRKKSWGLFSSAGLESGAFPDGLHMETVADKVKDYSAVLKWTNCTKAKDPVDCLINTSPLVLLNSSIKNIGHWKPVVDGVDLVESAAALARRGVLAPVPVIAGSVMEDINPHGINCHPLECNETDFRKWAKNWGFNQTEVERFVQLYSDEIPRPGGKYTKWFWAERHAGADAWGTCPTRRFIKWETNAKNNAFWYYWTYIPKGKNGEYPSLAHHACEQPFVFHVLSETPAQVVDDKGKYHIEESEIPLSAHIVEYWSSMARHGKPMGIVGWPKYDLQQKQALVIGDEFFVQNEMRNDKCNFWDDHFGNPNMNISSYNMYELNYYN